ncbi:MAG: hypothetical protein N3A01_03645 [Bacteroidales bacterium]|nr:hypothetical protein [Bacteroidales bacterium]
MNKKSQNSVNNLIINSLKAKSETEKKIHENLKNFYNLLKSVLNSVVVNYNNELQQYLSKNFFEVRQGTSHFELFFGEDVAIFVFKDYIFKIDESQSIWTHSYLQNNPLNAYVGIVDIYNFLKYSYNEDRSDDLGYLVGRILINRENHFYVEGKRQLAFLYSDLSNQIVEEQIITKVVESVILYCLSFEMLVPNYEDISIINVEQIKMILTKSKYLSAKRLGFQFYKNDTNV